MSLNKYRQHAKGKIDGWLMLAVLALSSFGLILIASASVVISHEAIGSNYAFVIDQAIRLGIGVVAMAIFSVIDYRFWQKKAGIILIAILGLLVATLLFGKEVNGAKSWLYIGSFGFQASELIKILSILYFAAWFSSNREKLKSFTQGFLPLVFMIAVIGALMLAQPDTGTAMVLIATIGIMYIVAGAPLSHIGISIGAGLAVLIPFILAAPYRLKRITAFLDPSSDTLGVSYHINQALLAVGAGGLLGLGFGNSKQKFLYLPEPHTDSIFAIAVEELGFLRAILIFAMIVLIVIRGLKIAREVNDEFAQLIAVGVSALIAVQAFVNIGAILGVFPFTGVTLPFVSYGGSSLITLLMGVGILLNISRHREA